MKKKVWPAILAGVAAILLWLLWNRDRTEWSDEVPPFLTGTWRLIEDFHSENTGIQSIHLSSNVIVLDVMPQDEDDIVRKRYPIRRVSITGDPGYHYGTTVIFYGAVDDETIAKHRLEIHFGRKKKISVQEIVPTGWGEDHWFDAGEFVKTELDGRDN